MSLKKFFEDFWNVDYLFYYYKMLASKAFEYIMKLHIQLILIQNGKCICLNRGIRD